MMRNGKWVVTTIAVAGSMAAMACVGALLAGASAHAGDGVLSGEPWIKAFESIDLHASVVAPDGQDAQCGMVDDTAARKQLQEALRSGLRPMPYMPREVGEGERLQLIGNWPYNDMGHDDGIYPRDYVNPVRHVKEVGHLLHELEVSVESEPLQVSLENVLQLEAPNWTRYLLIEFEPDGDQPAAGLYIRPHKPFVEDSVELYNFQANTPHPGLRERTPIEELAYRQAAFRSDNWRLDGQTQYVLLTRDMDPAPAGLDWHVAVAQLRSDEPVTGTVRVWASGSSYRAPLAIRWYYLAREEEEERGFFDPTPREPDDNPGRTVGEAWRWLLWRATEELLDELDFNGLFPIHMVASTFEEPPEHLPNVVGFGGGSATGGLVHPSAIAPGRARARMPGSFQPPEDPEDPNDHGFKHLPILPRPMLEREMGTDACRASAGSERGPRSFHNCDFVLGFDEPMGSLMGTVRLRTKRIDRAWDLAPTRDDGVTPTLFYNLIQHEIGHALGFSGGVLRSQAYVATFDPPRPALDQPREIGWSNKDEFDEEWLGTDMRRHFYGPIASLSEHNPWRHTHEPGPRLNDTNNDHSHLSFYNYDDLAGWDSNAVMQPYINSAPDFGVATDILADLGYASNTWAIQDRRLPRHWFDASRSGHGIDFRRVEREDGSMTHFLHFYTYDGQGNPRWYMAVGEVNREGLFEADLEWIGWDEDRSPRQQVDAGRSGTVRLDLDPALDHPSCEVRRESEADGWLYAVFEWELDGESGSWCMEPLRFGRLPAFPQEGSGSWFASDPDDTGWGLSVLTRNWGPRPIVNAIVYYYDAEGEPTWAWGLAGGDYMLPYGSLGDGVDIDMLHFNGFCRTCEPIQPSTESAGVLRLQINEQSNEEHGFNRVDLLDVTHRGPNGGQWLRENVGIRLLSSPHPAMFQ